MVTRINSPRSDRRRRTLVEVRGAAINAAETLELDDDVADGARHRKTYSSAAIDLLHVSLARCVPLRPFSLGLWLLMGVTSVAALLALESQRTAWRPYLTPRDLRAFDLAATDSVVTWLSSVAFLIVGAWSVVIYGLRQHKMNDYRGGYTVWLWLLGMSLIASVNATAPILDVPIGLCLHAGGWSAERATWCKAGVVGTPLVIVAVRMLFEVRSSRVALLSFATAVGFYLLRAWFGLAAAVEPSSLIIFLQAATYLCGHVLLVFSLAAFARHVTLDALGRLPAITDRRAPRRYLRWRRNVVRELDANPGGDQPKGVEPCNTKDRGVAASDQSASRSADRSENARRARRASNRSSASNRVADGPADSTQAQPDSLKTVAKSPATRTVVAKAAAADDSDEDESLLESGNPDVVAFSRGNDDEYGDPQLSRAERKRLKKEQRQQRRAA